MKRGIGAVAACVMGLAVMTAGAAEPATLALDALDLAFMSCGWAKPMANRSVNGTPLQIGAETFARGVGTHAQSELYVELDGRVKVFRAKVGVDAGLGNPAASVVFEVEGDDRILWSSGVCRAGEAPRACEVPLSGVRFLVLRVTDAGDGVNYDHANWADAAFDYAGAAPRAVAVPVEAPYLLTPPPSPVPRINGARVFGVRPGHPVVYSVAATGERPLTFAARGLPRGVRLDPETGRLSGAVEQAGEYRVTLTARNARGRGTRELRLVVGGRIALTPPMGWNSWNCFGPAVTQQNIRDAADALVKAGLKDHGWSYVNIDDYWTVKPGSTDPSLQGPARDARGEILPNPRFPDMAGLCDYIHGLGLRVGIYSSPGELTCGECAASYGHEAQDAATFARWGIDYLKYDWCSYERIAKNRTLPELMKPYLVMRDALRRQKRDIVYSLCQYGMGHVSAWGAVTGGQCWRTTGDITDTWESMSGIGFGQAGLELFAGPGAWNDPDMLVVGQVGWGGVRPTRLTPNEQYTHVSLWCLLASPLLIGCDLTRLDAFTLNLLTNDEVLEVNQDPLGRQAARVSQTGLVEVWAKPMEDGSLAVGLFNRGGRTAPVGAAWPALGITGRWRARDLWRQRELGVFADVYTADVPRHGCVLVRLWPAP